MSENQKLFAVLIDGDNAQIKLIPQILSAISEYGKPILKKIYGDWTKEQLQNWRSVAHTHDIEVKHDYNVSSGKNATDIVLVIDAMDILRERGSRLGGFCIVSSDSDFTYLARRLKKDGMFVLGIGSEKSKSLTEAYDKFISTESLEKVDTDSTVQEETTLITPYRTKQPISPINIPATEDSANVATSTQPERGLMPTISNELLTKIAIEYVIWSEETKQRHISIVDLKLLLQKKNPELIKLTTLDLVNGLKVLHEEYPQLFILEEIPDSKPVRHSLQIDNDFCQFFVAYQRTLNSLNYKHDNGWVLLSAFGDELGNYQIIENNVVVKQLKKKVGIMCKRYPSLIELNTDNIQPTIRLHI